MENPVARRQPTNARMVAPTTSYARGANARALWAKWNATAFALILSRMLVIAARAASLVVPIKYAATQAAFARKARIAVRPAWT
jgi:hypothetical protein